MSEQNLVTAAILVIGDEILSGRTKDKNIGYMAEYMTAVGIDLREVRVVPDIEEEIVTAAKALSGRYTYLFTTGGIGPTHDDITADCIAKAAGVGIDIDERAVSLLRERFPNPDDLNEARLRMAAAVQSFISGNTGIVAYLPTTQSITRGAETTLAAWRSGLKAITLVFDPTLAAPRHVDSTRRKIKASAQPHAQPISALPRRAAQVKRMPLSPSGKKPASIKVV